MAASFSSTSYAPDNLIVGEQTVLSRSVTLLSGQNLVRGAVLGKISVGSASSAAKSGGNTGNGTNTLDAVTPTLAGVRTGVYTLRVITAAANGGTLRVTDPLGNVLGDVAVGATFANQIKFVVADGATDFIVGDGFDVTVAAGSSKYRQSASASTDGSETPDCILAEPTDASAGDVATVAYYCGGFNSSAIVLGAGHTAASIKEGLRLKDIHLIDVLAIQ